MGIKFWFTRVKGREFLEHLGAGEDNESERKGCQVVYSTVLTHDRVKVLVLVKAVITSRLP
jgi:hypothetical protein